MHHQIKLIEKKNLENKKRRNRLPLTWVCSSLWNDILGFKEIYSTLWSLKYFAYRKEIPKVRASRMSLM